MCLHPVKCFDVITLATNSHSHQIQGTDASPIYLNLLVQTYAPSRSLRSASERRLVVPSQRGTKSLSRTFSWTVPSWWNDLPISIRIQVFSHFQKTSKDTSFLPAPDQLILTLTYSILF